MEETTQKIAGVRMSHEKIISAIDELLESSRQSSIEISKIKESIEKIGQKVKAIDSISDQTKVLAINAGIESARAGESGKGFSVVAGEVGKLASRSNAATEEINDIVRALLSDVNSLSNKIANQSTEGEKILSSLNSSLNE